MVGNYDIETNTLLLETKDSALAEVYSLVLTSVSIDHHFIQPKTGYYHITVSPEELLRAEWEIRSYLEENRNWPPPQSPKDTYSPFFKPFTLFFIGILGYFYNLTGPWDQHSQWFEAGAGQSSSILYNHEYYRLITPLFLHADLVHLAGNCLIGGVMLHFLLQNTGNGLGFFMVLITATLANFCNILLHGPNHNFVGFSTAVFAAIGLQVGFTTPAAIRQGSSLKHYLLPIMAGLGLLAITGSGGERTDLGAHFFGLLCGLFCGILWHNSYKKIRENSLIQFSSMILSILIITISWVSAFK